MNQATLINPRAHAMHRHLRENESECIKRNIIVRVDTINDDQSVAFCSVEQRLTGFLRRTYSVNELIWRAEQALAPLSALGLVTMLTVRHKSLRVAPADDRLWNSRAPMDWVPALWRWLGSPFAREGFGAVPVIRDPFGWKRAMHLSNSN